MFSFKRRIKIMTKKLIISIVSLLVIPAFLLTAQEDESKEENKYEYPKQEKIYPSPKAPRIPGAEQIRECEEKNAEKAGEQYLEDCRDTFKYGLTDEIATLLDGFTADKDCRFVNEAYETFQETKSPKIRLKILSYFAALKDPCLEDFAVEVINDPYDEKADIVDACFNYIKAVGSKDAVPGVMELLEKDEDTYFSNAVAALGEIGGSAEAQYLAQFIHRDDLSVQQKQSLMKVLGKLKADETFEDLSSIAQDTDQDLFVRCYAAEAIGEMERSESVPVLLDLYEADEPRLREHVVRGIAHYNEERTKKLIVQALKDDNYRVRLEALNAVQKLEISSADKDIIYHCKHKEEKVVKEKCYKVLAKLSTSAGNEYLVSVMKDKKAGDDTKAKVAAALLENGTGIDEVIECAKETLKDDKKKNLRYALGKEFAKYDNQAFSEICILYLESKDPSTQGTGLDIFSRGRYSLALGKVQDIAASGDNSKKVNANAKKAKRILENLYGSQSDDELEGLE